MRKTIVVLAMLALAVPVLAGTLAPQAVLGEYGSQGGSRGVTVYDNTANLSGWAFGEYEGYLDGDDLHMTAGGVVETVKFSIYNYSGAGSALNSIDADVVFFDINTFAVIGGVSFTGISWTGGLPLGYYSAITSGDLSAFNIVVPQDVIMGVMLSNGQWAGAAGYPGQILANPPVVGTSDSTKAFFTNWSTPGWWAFSNTAIPMNLYYAVNIVPEPAALALLGLGALALIRRR